MKIKEAIGILKQLTHGLYEDGYVKIANDLAIAALEKQIPNEPINDSCPSCKQDVRNWTGDNDFNNCPNCGQALKWEVEK